MHVKLLMVVFLALLLVGCATPGKVQNIQTQQLQNRINCLEAEVDRKNQEISRLEDELEKTMDITLGLPKQEEKTMQQLSIKQIQGALKNAGFYNGSIDGKMGPQTKEAMKTFQRANGLKADGIIGKRTRQKLSKYLDQ